VARYVVGDVDVDVVRDLIRGELGLRWRFSHVLRVGGEPVEGYRTQGAEENLPVRSRPKSRWMSALVCSES
jgi:hypothetical protein